MLYLVAESGRTYNYTVGIDRKDIILLCYPMNTSVDPISYIWRVSHNDFFMNNPIMFSNFARIDSTFVCDLTTLIVRGMLHSTVT